LGGKVAAVGGPTESMPLKESEAIVLRSFPLGEGDRLVSFLDRQSGKMRGVAKGARLPKSRFGSTLELLAYIKIWYFERENKDLVRINQCELIESFMDVQNDYQSGVCLALISEVTEAVLGEREVADPQFRLVLLAARAIREHGPSEAVMAYFALWTTRLGGWLGPLDRCSQCGASAQSATLYASPSALGFLCDSCRQEWMPSVSALSLAAGKKAVSGNLNDFLKEKFGTEAIRGILNYALNIIEYHIEKKLNSRQMLEMGDHA
jgi:DNA repair protein RecO (recombination protein O)